MIEVYSGTEQMPNHNVSFLVQELTFFVCLCFSEKVCSWHQVVTTFLFDLLLYAHGIQMRSFQDSQLLNHMVPGQVLSGCV